MPRKKSIQTSDSFTAGKPEPEPVVIPEPVAEVVYAQDEPKCGHINRHYTGAEVLACELPQGHAGNHQAHYINRGNPEIAAWKDEAGYAISN